jgi:hypothetical protein
MKKRWLIFIYVFTHLGLVFRLIWFNYKKKQTRLSVAKLSQIETPNFGNEVEIDFMQQGAILIVIKGQFVFPLLNGDGRFKIPVALIESNQVVVSIIGLFQSYSKKVAVQRPISFSVKKQLRPKQDTFDMVGKPLFLKGTEVSTISKLEFSNNLLSKPQLIYPRLMYGSMKISRNHFLDIKYDDPKILNLEEIAQQINKTAL